MRSNLIVIPTLLIFGGCQQQDDTVCKPLEATKSMDQCVHYEAYKLASAPGPNVDIARAATAACDGAIWEAAQFTADFLNRTEGIGEGREDHYPPLKRTAQEMALQRVVEARAGHCKPLKMPEPAAPSE